MTKTEKLPIPVGVDGKYRWVYELTILNNPKRLFLFLKGGLLFSLLLALLLVFGRNREYPGGRLLGFIHTFLFYALIISVLILILSIILRKLEIGSTLMLYQMDEDGIRIYRVADRVSKYDVQKKLAIMAGQMKGDPAADQMSLLDHVSGRDAVMYHAVSAVSYRRFWRRIKVKSGMRTYNIYAARRQGEFILNTIFANSAKARMGRKK